MNEILHGDCIQVMRSLPKESVDLVITSPPYNLGTPERGRKPDGRKSKWQASELMVDGYQSGDDNMPHADYVDWQRRVLSACLRLLKPDGAIFYNHKWRTQGGLLDTRHEIIDGFPVRQIIIWNRPGAIPQGSTPDGATFFNPDYEVVFLIVKGKRFRIRRGKNGQGCVWRMNYARGNPHPAPFPVELPMRCIDACLESNSDAVVLDPFMGSGTTAIAAIRHGVNWIGIEKSEAYVEMANIRINLETVQGRIAL